jgi:D-galactarolactone cycloisomerase
MPAIERIEIKAYEYAIAPDKAYGMARSLNVKRVCTLIAVTTDQGTVGYGEASGPPRVLQEYLAIVRPFFVGRRVFDFEIVAAQVYNRLYHYGVQGHLTSCLSGIGMALHDAIGKGLGLPVHDLIGGRSSQRLMVYATSGVFGSDDNDGAIEAQLDEVKRGGYRAVKIKIGRNPKSDRERVRIARNVIGDDILLMVDVNGNYTPDIAYESIRLVEPYDIHWYEEPLPPTDVRGYGELRSRSPIRIAAGEACYTVHDFRRLIEAHGVDILQPALMTCGGFGQAKAIAQLAAMNGLRIMPNGFGGAVAWVATLHYVASLPISPFTENVPYPNMVEHHTGANPFFEHLLKTPIAIRNGETELPAGPGLGIDIDFAAVQRYALAG